ncbi:MAG: hypothetical protein KGI80_05035 [Verrucomicrobiota bacterium]|nr:hypothetical protein [Verrucomicrobiota bacterium]
MKGSHIWVCLVAIAGVFLTLLLVPTSEEVAFMEWNGGHFSAATRFYLEEYDKGNRSTAILVGLSRACEYDGDVERSIALVKELLLAYPNDPFALKKLADLYMTNQQYEEYFQTLLQLRSLGEDGETLQELANWYSDANEAACLFPILVELMSKGKGDANGYLQLSYFYAEKNEYEKAYQTLETLRHLFPKEVAIYHILFEVWVMNHIPSKKGEAQVALLTEFLNQKKDPKLGVQAIQFVYKESPLIIRALFKQLRSDYWENPAFQTMALSIFFGVGEGRETVLQEALSLYQKPQKKKERGLKSCPNRGLENLLFSLWLEKECYGDLFQLDATKIDPSLLVDFSLIAIKKRRPALAKKMQELLGEQYLEFHPGVAQSLAVAARELYVPQEMLTLEEKIYLLKTFAADEQIAGVKRIGDSLYPYRSLTLPQLFDVADSYVAVKKGDLLYAQIAGALCDRPDSLFVLAFLDLAAGRPLQAEEKLQKFNQLPEFVLATLFSKAEDLHECQFSLYVAEKRNLLYPGAAARDDYAFALVQTGHVEEGLSMLKENEKMTLAALSFAAASDPAYRPRLRSWLKKRQRRASCEDLRTMAYAYQDSLYDFKSAEKIFWRLSKNAPANSDDVQALVYLWGPELRDTKKINWLISQAKKVSSAEWNDWLEYLVYVGQWQTVIELSKERGDLCSFAYMDALSWRKEKALLAMAVPSALPRAKTLSDFKRLAAFAQQSEAPLLELSVWERALSLFPDDPSVLQGLGNSAFNAHHFRDVVCYLQRLLDLYEVTPDLFLSIYEYGISLRHLDRYVEGSRYLRWALCLLDQICDPDIQERITRSVIIQILNEQRRDALCDAKIAYELSSYDANVAADYANLLMDLGRFRQADHVLYPDCKEDNVLLPDEVFALSPLPSCVKKLRVEATPVGQGGWRLSFCFPEPIKACPKTSCDPTSFYLDFDQSIDSPDFPKVEKHLSYLLKAVLTGSHTLQLVAARPVCWYLGKESDNVLSLEIIPQERFPEDEDHRLAIARVRLFLEERRYKKALSLADSLEPLHNRDVDLLAAGVEGLLPCWQKQVQILQDALAKDPCDEELLALWRDAYHAHTPFLLYERQLQDTALYAAVQVNRGQGEAIVQRTKSRTLYLGAEYQTWRGHCSMIAVNNAQGEPSGFLGTRQQGDLYLRNEWASGSFLKGIFYAQAENVYGAGAAGGCLIPSLQGDITGSVDWNRPCWEIFNALAYHGRETKARFQLNSVTNRYFNWHIGGGGRAVGITGTPVGYASILANAELNWNVIAKNPGITLTYSLESEYVEYVKTKIGATGIHFEPCALTSFEFHTPGVWFSWSWWDRCSLRIFAGETFNRLGIDSPNAAVEFKYRNPCYFDIQLGAYQFPSQVVPGTEMRYFVATVSGRF